MSGDSSWLCNPSYKAGPAPSIHDSQRTDSSKRPLSHKDLTEREKGHRQKSTGTKRKKDEDISKSKVFVKSADDLAGSSFRLDSKADSENLHYDGLYSGDVATYRRRFEVVGLGRQQWVELNDGRSKVKEKAKKEKQLRYFRKSVVGEKEGVVSLVATRRSSDCCGQEFLRLQVKQSAESAEMPTVESYTSQLTSEYNKSLLDDPHNVQLWLEFIALQDQLGGWRKAEDEKVGKVKRAVMERKVAIFERALEHNSSSVELLTGYMELVREFWETAKIVRKWKDIVFHQPNRSGLWLSYIHFCQTSFSSFSVSSQLALFRKCVTTLVSILSGSLQSHRPEPQAQDKLLYIIFLYSQFLHHSGHSEKAVACYQALIEFNLCCPRALSHESSKTRQEFFETFWDSGCSRFGEAGAIGWDKWTASNQTSSAPSTTLGLLDVNMLLEVADSADMESEEAVDPEIAMISGKSLPDAWLTLEVSRTKEHCLPWRPDESRGESEEDCSDPDRLVLFDDVSPTLVDIRDPEIQFKLVLGYLRLLGAPVTMAIGHMTATTIESLSQVSLDLLGSLSCFSEQSVRLLHPLGFSSLTASSLSEFGQAVINELLSSTASHPPSRAVHNAIVTSINQALSLISDNSSQTQLVQVLLTFLLSHLKGRMTTEARQTKLTKLRVKAVQKLIKNMLRFEAHRNNLTLWNSCALTEHLLGNFQDASKLYQSLLTQHPTPIAELVCSYCECVLGVQSSLTLPSPPPQAQQLTLALHAIVCFTEEKYTPLEGTSVSPARILRARTKFEQTVSSDRNVGVCDILCHCYFEYVLRGVEVAGGVFQQWTDLKISQLQQVTKHSMQHSSLLQTVEHLFTRQIQLVERHSRLHPHTPPKVIRSILERALSMFPDNHLFLAKFIESEQMSFISGRLRRFFDNKSSTSSSCILWLYSIAAELQHYCHIQQLIESQHVLGETSTGTVNRLKAVLSRATESGSGQHCPLLWRIYMMVVVS